MSAPEARQALAALALGVLPAEEARNVEEHARDDAVLAGELDGYRATMEALERVLVREPAPTHLFEAGRRMPRAWSLRLVRRRDLVFAAALLAVAGLIGFLALRSGGPQADARAEIIAASGGAARGEALLYDTRRDDGRLVLRLDGVPALEPGHHYQVWVLRVGSETMEAVDVSIEEDAGDPAQSGRSLAAGAFS